MGEMGIFDQLSLNQTLKEFPICETTSTLICSNLTTKIILNSVKERVSENAKKHYTLNLSLII